MQAERRPKRSIGKLRTTSKRKNSPRRKSEIVALLAESFAEVRKAMEAAEARTLTRDVAFFSRKVSLRGVYVFLDTHAAEHLGQAIAYARANGLTPP